MLKISIKRQALLISMLAPLFSICVANEQEPFSYFADDWNVVSLSNYDRGTRISPSNGLTISGNEERKEHEGDVTVRISFGRELEQLSRKQEKTNIDGWIPVIKLTAMDGEVKYDFKIWATPLPTVKDWKKAYDWPTEGENFLTWVWVKVTNTGTGPAAAKLKFEQDRSRFSKYEHPVPMLKDPLEFDWPRLDMGASDQAVIRIPQFPIEGNPTFEDADPSLWLNRTIDYWDEKMQDFVTFEVPCKKATCAMKSSRVHQLFNCDKGIVMGGEGIYDCFWLRDCAYALMQMEEAGMDREARITAEHFLTYSNPETGRMDSTGEYDGNGQAQWTIWQYYKITGDNEWLKKAYPHMLGAAKWTMAERRKNATGSQFEGLLTGCKADGENRYDEKLHIVGYDLWNLRGMLCTTDAAKALGKLEDHKMLKEESKLYRQAIDTAWKKTGYSYFPPTWEKWDEPETPTCHWGNTETLWPTEIFEANDLRIIAMINEVRNDYGGGFRQGMIQWNPNGKTEPKATQFYLTCYTTLADMIRGNDEQVVEDFYWLLMHSTATNAFAEGLFYEIRQSRSDAYPHVTGHAMYSNLLRHMLIHETGDTLQLLSAVPDWWLEKGKVIKIKDAPTHFGKMSLVVEGKENGVQIQFEAPTRVKPKEIILTLPESRPLIGKLDGISIKTRPDHKRRWDFPTIIEEYKKCPSYVPMDELLKKNWKVK